MKILGIDPGYGRVGWGILEYTGDKITASCHGCIETAKEMAHGERLLVVKNEVSRLIAKFKPETLAIEKLFFQKNAKTALAVGEGRGVVLLAVAEAKMPIIEITPLLVKQTVTGSGSADKKQVQFMVKLLLKLSEVPEPDDAADALAIAITGMRLAATAKRLAEHGK